MYGGDVWYLCRWMRESGLAELLPSLGETLYVGVSAGSMVTAPVFGETYNDPNTPFVIDQGLGLVDFALLPHLDHKDHPESSTANAERMAAEVPVVGRFGFSGWLHSVSLDRLCDDRSR